MDFLAIALSVVVGHFLARATVGILRRLLGLGSTAKGEKLLVALIGVSERAIVTALMIHKADIVPWFIGAWVLLKFAGGWKRFTDPSLELPTHHGEIRSRDLNQSYQTLTQCFSDFSKFSVWFGRYVTQPKYPELIQPLPVELQLEGLVQRMEAGSILCHNPSSRFAFIECSPDSRIFLFADGDIHHLSSVAIEAVSLLCSVLVFLYCVLS